jgi:hypothetical protein
MRYYQRSFGRFEIVIALKCALNQRIERCRMEQFPPSCWNFFPVVEALRFAAANIGSGG